MKPRTVIEGLIGGAVAGSDGGSFSLMLDPQRWAERVAAFASQA